MSEKSLHVQKALKDTTDDTGHIWLYLYWEVFCLVSNMVTRPQKWLSAWDYNQCAVVTRTLSAHYTVVPRMGPIIHLKRGHSRKTHRRADSDCAIFQAGCTSFLIVYTEILFFPFSCEN